MNPLAYRQTSPPDSASVGSIKTASLKKQSLALNVTGLAEPMEVSLNCRTGSESVGASRNERTATAVNSGSTVASVQATTTPWFEQTVDDFGEQARQSAMYTQAHIPDYFGACKRPFIVQAKESALKQIEAFHKRVAQYFTDHSDSWQSCMDWLIRLTPEDIGCREQLNLLPVELIQSRPDLPQQMADQAQTIEQLAAQQRLCLRGMTEISSQKYRASAIDKNDLLKIYLESTSTLRYRFLQIALERAPRAQVGALLRHWLHDINCKEIAECLTEAPLHPTLITPEEPLLQDLLTLCATRLLQPTRCHPVAALVSAADHRLVQHMASCDHKVSFGRTLGAIGAGENGRNLYLKCKRFNEKQSDFMAEQAMLSWLHTTPLQLESATLKPHGTMTFKSLASLFQELQLNAKQKVDLVSTLVYNNKALVESDVLKQYLAEHSPGGVAAWDRQYQQPENWDNPYCMPRNIDTEQQLAHFLHNLPFPEQNRAAFIDDLLPALGPVLRAHLIQQGSSTLSDEQHWELLRTILPAGTMHSAVTAYLFSTPADAHYHHYVSDRAPLASQHLAKRPQAAALRAYLRDCGRLFRQGVLGPPACNMFHNIYSDSRELYRFLYTSDNRTRPGRIRDFDGHSSNYPNIGPVPMTLRDGGDARCITPVGWRQPVQNSLASLPHTQHWPGTVEDKEAAVESLACACLGTVLLLGRILKAGTESNPESWFNSRDPKKESALADLLGDMVVDLFSHSFAIERTTLHALVCKRDKGQLIGRCAREMQAWMSDAFTDPIVAKTVPAWLYPHYTGKRDNLLICDDSAYSVYQQLAGHPNHDLGLRFATTPLQGFEILIKKALAESVLLASRGACASSEPLHIDNCKDQIA